MSTMSQRSHLNDSEAWRVVGSVNGSETPKYERYSSPTTPSLGYWHHGFNSDCPKPDPCSPTDVPYAAAIGDDFILMDDNCRPHHANLVEDFVFEEGIVRMESYKISGFFSDSINTIQHLASWPNVRDRTDTDILKILKRLSLSRQIHFQWIPSYVNIVGNEIVDSLARAAAGEITMPATPLTYLELFSKYKANNRAIWMIPPVHPWYPSKSLGGSVVRGRSRRDPTALTHFLSGHLMSLTFVDGIKHFEICTKCSSVQASPGHILFGA
ncbi:RNase H domain-containing protein [Trichonephila clavipes]|nr:RNase H domain-containing protein [Trichonephila clavipes]